MAMGQVDTHADDARFRPKCDVLESMGAGYRGNSSSLPPARTCSDAVYPTSRRRDIATRLAEREARTAHRIWAWGQSAAAGALRPRRFGILARVDLEGQRGWV